MLGNWPVVLVREVGRRAFLEEGLVKMEDELLRAVVSELGWNPVFHRALSINC